MVFVTGGARSGKSRFAERLALERGGDVAYIATARPGDAEMRARIARHRQRRPSAWRTIEAGTGLARAIGRAVAESDTVLVDCMTVHIANLLLFAGRGEADPARSAAAVDKSIEHIIDICLKEEYADLILVSNEVGMGIVPEKALGRLFRDLAGRANQRLAAVADEVYLCVSGIPVLIKKGAGETAAAGPRPAASGPWDIKGSQAAAGFFSSPGGRDAGLP